MSIVCSDIIEMMEKLATPWLAEEWDNVGLLLGSRRQKIKKVITCLDVTAKVVDEAIKKKADLILSHHPFIFKGMKSIVQEDVKGELIYKLIRNNIAVYSAHTNLDVAHGGLNEYLASILGLTNIQGLKRYAAEKMYKLVVFVPEESVDQVRNAMSAAGTGWIGNYSDCSFMAPGTGTFKPLEGTKPYIGEKDRLEKVKEFRLETIVPQERVKTAIEAMLKAHPYEEVAYDLYRLEEPVKEYNLGCTGKLEVSQSLEEFISTVKKSLGINTVKLIGEDPGNIHKVAVFCGSYDNEYMSAIQKSGADVLVTGDVKHHDALDMAELGLCVVDAGHFGTERVIVPKLAEWIKQSFPELEVEWNTVEADPISFC